VDLRDLDLTYWIDPRVLLVLDDEPPEVRASDTATRLQWYRQHHPSLVKSDADARAQAERLARYRQFWEACRRARRLGLAAPVRETFFPDDGA
jgi:hypothetical protein